MGKIKNNCQLTSVMLFSLLSTHNYLEMPALVWLRTFQVRAIEFGTKGKNLVLHSSKHGMCRCCRNFQYCQRVDASYTGHCTQHWVENSGYFWCFNETQVNKYNNIHLNFPAISIPLTSAHNSEM